MLALLSSKSDIAIGWGRRVKKTRSCFTPSSKTEKSDCSRSVRYRLAPSITVTLSDTMSIVVLNDGACLVCGWADARAVRETTTRTAARNARFTSSSSLPARRRPAHRHTRAGRGNLGLFRRDERVRPAVDNLVLRGQLSGELLKPGDKSALGEEGHKLPPGFTSALIEHQGALALLDCSRSSVLRPRWR